MRIACRLSGIAVFMIVLAGPGWAQVVPMPRSRNIYTRPAPRVEEPAARVAEQIRALDSESAATRRNARQALLAMGAAIQPQLRQALQVEDTKAKANPAVVSRVRAELMVLISYLEDERHAKTSTVTLHRKDAPLVDTLREIGVQVGAGGVTLSGDNLADKFEWVDSARVSLDIEKLDYWSALRAIRNQLGFVADLPILNFHRPREKEGYLSADPKQMPYDAEGAIVTGPLLITRQLEARGENLLLTLRVIPEAKVYESLSETGRYAILQIDEYTDDQGRSLLPSGQALVFPSITSGFDRAWQWRIDALLPRPAATRRIGSLKARIGVSVGPPQTELAAVDLTRGTGQLFEFDGVGVLVTSVVPSESTYTVTGEIIAPTNSPVGRALSDVDGGGANYLGLRDKTGAQILRDLGPSSVRSEAGVTTLTWTLKGRALRQPDGIPRSGPPPGGSIIVCNANCVPVALYWVTPSNTHWFYTPFEMRNVAVPAAGR